MFRFNFDNSLNNNNDSDEIVEAVAFTTHSTSLSQSLQWIEPSHVEWPKLNGELPQQMDIHFRYAQGVINLRRVIHMATKVRDSTLIQVEEQSLDIASGVYEGGFKVWESSIQLVDYMLNHRIEFSERKNGETRWLQNRNVLELGCGHALPSIAALRLGARRVVLQDLNREVLERISAVNVIINDETMQSSCKLVAGDWRHIDKMAELLLQFMRVGDTNNEYSTKFDVVLTCETIYSKETAPALAELMTRVLERGGIALVAAKRFYFGVGGGSFEFRKVVDSSRLRCDGVVDTRCNGKSNTCDILKFTRI